LANNKLSVLPASSQTEYAIQRLLEVLRWPWFSLLLASIILIVRVAQMDRPDILVDDAFISFRYAHNLAQGQGLVFNPGERVEGYTNFLWTMLLAGCAWLGLDLVPASKTLSILATLGTLAGLSALGRALFAGRPRAGLQAGLPPLLYATMGSQARHVVSGMETPLFVLLVTLAVYVGIYRRQPLLTGGLFALAAMTRPEGLMYLVLFCGYQLLTTRDGRLPQTLTLLAGFLALYGAYFLWRYAYYGYLLPNTFYAKASGFHWMRLARGWDYLRQLVSWWGLAPFLLLASLSLLSLRREQSWGLFLLFVLATLAYFVFVGGDFIVWFGPRFLMPILPFLLLMSVEGLTRLNQVAWLAQRVGLWVELLAAGLLLVNAYGFSWPARYFDADIFTTQMRGWAELGRWIATNTPPDTSLASDAAGLIPFYSSRHTIDMYGKTDLHIAHLDLAGRSPGIVAHEKFDPYYVLQRQPDCIVSTFIDEQGGALASGLPLVKEEFEAAYSLAAVARVKNGPPPDGQWVLSVQGYSTELYRAGYTSGLYCRRQFLAGGGG